MRQVPLPLSGAWEPPVKGLYISRVENPQSWPCRCRKVHPSTTLQRRGELSSRLPGIFSGPNPNQSSGVEFPRAGHPWQPQRTMQDSGNISVLIWGSGCSCQACVCGFRFLSSGAGLPPGAALAPESPLQFVFWKQGLSVYPGCCPGTCSVDDFF